MTRPAAPYHLFVFFADAKDVFALLKGREKTVKGGEEPTFTWFKSGQEFDPEDRFKVLFKDEEDTLALVFQVLFCCQFMYKFSTYVGSEIK